MWKTITRPWNGSSLINRRSVCVTLLIIFALLLEPLVGATNKENTINIRNTKNKVRASRQIRGETKPASGERENNMDRRRKCFQRNSKCVAEWIRMEANEERVRAARAKI